MVRQQDLDRCTRPRVRRGGARRWRRGISLLEVLISMFIILFGLLGIAAMFPAGQYHASRAIRYDRTAALGQAAFNDIRVRGLLRPDVWLQFDESPVPAENRNDPFMIDPLGIGAALNANPPDANAGTFPYMNGSLARLTVPDATSGAMDAAIAEQIFKSRDDLVIDFPSDRDEPSQPMFRLEDGSEVALADATGQPAAYRSFAADYSWMFMAAPQLDTTGNATGEYLVSVIVFHKRTLPVNELEKEPDEALVVVDPAYPPSRWGGGEIRLKAAGTLGRKSLEMVRPGQWLMLSGILPTDPPSPVPNYFKWYRIVAADEIDGGGNDVARFVSLKGPDWNEGVDPLTVQATLVDGVVAVYEKVMPVDATSSPWAIR